MNDPRTSRADQRWLVIAPHPDDETLATGGLLQRARAAGAAVHVVLLTDGADNAWPQRWLERRWRLEPADRERWGRRRRDECRAALRALGLDPARDLTALGWPDGGVTERFCRGPAAFVAPLHALLREFAPTDVVVPAADDRHPDHNVCPVLLEVALAGTSVAPRTYAYRVHGATRGDALRLELTPAEAERKRSALECHATQLALSGGRFTGLASGVERYDSDPFGAAAARSAGWPGWVERPLAALQRDWQWRVVDRDPAGTAVCRTVPVPRAAHQGRPDGIFTKLEAGRRGPWIYDSHGWQRRDVRAR